MLISRVIVRDAFQVSNFHIVPRVLRQTHARVEDEASGLRARDRGRQVEKSWAEELLAVEADQQEETVLIGWSLSVRIK